MRICKLWLFSALLLLNSVLRLLDKGFDVVLELQRDRLAQPYGAHATNDIQGQRISSLE